MGRQLSKLSWAALNGVLFGGSIVVWAKHTVNVLRVSTNRNPPSCQLVSSRARACLSMGLRDLDGRRTGLSQVVLLEPACQARSSRADRARGKRGHPLGGSGAVS